MNTNGLVAKSRFFDWLYGSRKGAADLSITLRKAIEREFLYRGSPSLEITSLAVVGNAASLKWYARPIYQNDDRLRYKPWAALFAEQTLEDTAKVLRTTWTHRPQLEYITLKVLQRSLRTLPHAETVIVLLQAAGETSRQAVLDWRKTRLCGLLRYCEMRYDIDPQRGLRGLSEEADD